ncbi:MAG: hypothetical protein ACOYK8_01280 [Alphaproteobacteria bacterium]
MLLLSTFMPLVVSALCANRAQAEKENFLTQQFEAATLTENEETFLRNLGYADSFKELVALKKDLPGPESPNHGLVNSIYVSRFVEMAAEGNNEVDILKTNQLVAMQALQTGKKLRQQANNISSQL